MTTQAPGGHHNLGFSLVQGGPLFRLFLRLRLQRPPVEWLQRRVLALMAIAWLPLAAFAALSGDLVGGVGVAFVFDIDVHIKFFVGLPLLIAAEVVVHGRIERVVQEFLDRGLVAPGDEPRFEALCAWATRGLTSSVAEALLLVFSFTGGYWLWRTQTRLPVATWYAGPTGLTPAGYWYAFLSLPLGRFLIFRWFYRMAVWYAFLWRVARLRLRLNPLHPDRAGGLGFLQDSVTAFALVPVSQSTILAGVIGNHIWRTDATLPGYKLQIAGFIAVMLLMLLIPPMFFAGQLITAKWNASHEFGALASRYVDLFGKKWLGGQKAGEDGLLGTSDIQSLADLANSYEVVRTMRPVPFDPRMVPWLVLLIVVPLLPLTLTMIPFSELIVQVFKLFI